jgi:hypothetical protein
MSVKLVQQNFVIDKELIQFRIGKYDCRIGQRINWGLTCILTLDFQLVPTTQVRGKGFGIWSTLCTPFLL